MSKVRLAAAAVFSVLAVVASACGGSTAAPKDDASASGTIVVYSGRKEELLAPVIKAFEAKTGIKAVVKYGKTAEFASLLADERGKPQADVFVSQDGPTLERVRRAGLLAGGTIRGIDRIPKPFRAADGSWTGVSGRSRALIYNTTKVQAAQVPDSIFDLTDPAWKGKIAMASSAESSVVAWLASIVELRGEKEAERLVKGLAANDVAVLGSHTDIRKAVGKGEYAIGLVNHYYFHLEKETGSPVEIAYTDQSADGIGSLVNVAGVGVVKGGPNPSAARAFAEFLISDEAQRLFAEVNFEHPLVAGIPAAKAKALGDIKASPVKLDALVDEIDTAIDILERNDIK